MKAMLAHTARGLADRRGITAIEYAMIAAGAMTIVAACYNAFFTRMSAMVSGIVIG